MTITQVVIANHTTASVPRPHILYLIDVSTADGTVSRVTKRYSDFIELHNALGDSESLPPKRILVTSFLPSAWVDDWLIAERKTGLATYLNNLINSTKFQNNPALVKFLSSSSPSNARQFNLEDALPSTLSRKAALEAQAKLLADEPVFEAATPIAAAYYPDWSAGSRPPESLDYSKFDILFFAFATPNSSSGISWDSGSTSILKRLVSSAKNSGKGTKIVLSIGGWGGSYYFSQAVSTAANRSKFVNAAVSAVNTYGLAGVDIDWEYPNSAGAGNPHSSADAANLLTFFTSLRSALGSSKIISAAVPHLPWLGSNGSPLTNVSAYAKQLTYVNIMNYDVWGASSNPGPNAPLGNLCGTSTQPQASAQAALKQWKAAGFPASKLLLGLALYGYVSNSSAQILKGSFTNDAGLKSTDPKEYMEQVLGLPTRDPAPSCPLPSSPSSEEPEGEPLFLDGKHERSKTPIEPADPKAVAGDLSAYFNSQIAFNEIVTRGALKKASNGTYVQANGYNEGWDNCSDTPYLFNVSRKTVVTYDDTYSLASKALFAKQNGMAGCFTWSLDQDDGYTLQNVIRKNLGK